MRVREKVGRWLVRLSVGLMLGLVVLGAGVLPASRAQDVDELVRRQQEAERRKREVQAKLREIKKRQRNLSAVINQLDRKLYELEDQVQVLAAKIQQIGEERDHIKQKLEELIAQRDQLKSKLNRRALALFLGSQLSPLELLVSAASLEDLTLNLFYLDLLMQNDERLVSRVRGAQSLVETEKARLDQKLRELTEAKADLEARKAELEQQRLFNLELKQAVDRDRVLWERQYAQYLAESKEIERRLRELIRQNKGYSGRWSGSFLKPVSGPITSPFGYRIHPIYRRRKMHTGIDFGAPYGAPVRAAESGKVVLAKWYGGYGLTVIIDHGVDSKGRHVQTLYGHNSRLLVKEGEIVARGQIIAKVGSTGVSTGPHAHFEVRVNGTPVNPASFKLKR